MSGDGNRFGASIITPVVLTRPCTDNTGSDVFDG
jgi:hypothetical protein